MDGESAAIGATIAASSTTAQAGSGSTLQPERHRQDHETTWPEAIVAVAFLAFLAFIFVMAGC